jgi:hypothetical protein
MAIFMEVHARLSTALGAETLHLAAEFVILGAQLIDLLAKHVDFLKPLRRGLDVALNIRVFRLNDGVFLFESFQSFLARAGQRLDDRFFFLEFLLLATD